MNQEKNVIAFPDISCDVLVTYPWILHPDRVLDAARPLLFSGKKAIYFENEREAFFCRKCCHIIVSDMFGVP